MRAQQIARQRHGNVAVEEDGGVIAKPELEHVGLEPGLEGLSLLLLQADELVVRSDRDRERVEFAVDLLEGELADARARSQGESGEKERRDERAGKGDARAGAVEGKPAHRSR